MDLLQILSYVVVLSFGLFMLTPFAPSSEMEMGLKALTFLVLVSMAVTKKGKGSIAATIAAAIMLYGHFVPQHVPCAVSCGVAAGVILAGLRF